MMKTCTSPYKSSKWWNNSLKFKTLSEITRINDFVVINHKVATFVETKKKEVPEREVGVFFVKSFASTL